MDTDRDHGDRLLRKVQIAVFAKAPIAELAKTRLIRALGLQGAARLQRQLTRRTVQTALEARLGAVTLWCTPNTQHRFFRALHATTGVHCLVQSSGDLGERMHTAYRLHCAAGPLLRIGTDCPVLRRAHLREAARAMTNGDDAVLAPAEDGGYVLVGLRQPCPGLFANVIWGRPDVMHETRRRARAASLRLCELETLWDVDLPADLPRLHALLSSPNK